MAFCQRQINDFVSAISSARRAQNDLDKDQLEMTTVQNMMKDQLVYKTKCLIGRLLTLQGEYRRAASEYQSIIEYLSHKPIDSTTSLIESKDISSQIFSAYLNLASCHFSLKEYQSCKSFIEAALEISREKSQPPAKLSSAYESLGLVCEKLNFFEESVKAYDLMMQYEIPQN